MSATPVPINPNIQPYKTVEVTENGDYDIVPDTPYNCVAKVGLSVDVDTSGAYNSGYTSGYTDGYASGSTDGYSSGYTEGYNDGNEFGYDRARSNFEQGGVGISITGNGHYDASINYQQLSGWISGVTVDVDQVGPYNSGYTEGYNVGRSDGYDNAVSNFEQGGVGLTVTGNGHYDAVINSQQLSGWISGVTVDVPTGSTINNQNKAITATTNGHQIITFDSGYTGLGTVDLNIDVPTGSTDNKLASLVDASITAVTASDLGNITSIKAQCFRYCSSLQSVSFPSSITSIGEYAFADCTSLNNVVIPDGVTGLSQYCFAGDSNLSNITIPEGVVRLGSTVFGNCSKLATLVLPSTLKNFNQSMDSYNGRWALENLYILATAVPILDGYYNNAYVPDNVTLWVPLNLVNPYKINSGWNQIITNNNWTILGICDSIEFRNVTWVNDIPMGGGTATKDNCSFQIFGIKSGTEPVDITDYCTVTGSTVVPPSTASTRHQAGTLTLTATYGMLTASTQVTIWQSSADMSISPKSLEFNPTGETKTITISGSGVSDWSITDIKYK